MKILITGVLGHIGSNLANALSSAYDVYGVDIYPEHGLGNITYNQLDITDKKFTQYLQNNAFNAIINCAVLDRTSKDQASLDQLVKNDVQGTRNLMDAVVKSGSCPQLIYCSSAEVYPNNQNGVSVDTETGPQTTYGVANLLCEELFRYYSRVWNIPVAIFRLFDVYGGTSDKSEIAEMVHAINNGEQFPIYNSGEYIRDWIHVDTVTAIIRKCISMMPVTGTWLVGSAMPINAKAILTDKFLVEKVLKTDKAFSLKSGISGTHFGYSRDMSVYNDFNIAAVDDLHANVDKMLRKKYE